MYASHLSFPLISLPDPALTSIFDPFDWVFDNDINWASNDEAAPAYGGKGSGGGDAGPSGVSPSGKDGYDLPGSSDAVPLEQEEYTPLLTRSHIGAGSSSFDAIHFYQYMDDHFSCLNLSLDAIDERQQ